jgi:hypothetical protein
VVLEGLDGVADFTAQKQQAFEAWITRVARQAHEDRDREVTVVLEYMQELRGVDSDDPPTPSPSKLEPVEPPSRLQPLLVNGFAIGAYVVLRTLMLNSAAQAIRSGPSGGGTIDEGGGELRGASGAPPGVRLQARALVEGRAAAVGGTVVDTHAVAEGNGETSEGNAGEGKRSPTRYVVMACQVHVSDNNDATGGEVSKESAAKEARQMLAERLNGGQLSQLAELAELLNGGDLQMNMPACEDAVSGLRATPRLGLPTHKANPAWRIANNTCVRDSSFRLLAVRFSRTHRRLGVVCPHSALTNEVRPRPEHSNAITTVDKLPGMLFLLSSALVRALAPYRSHSVAGAFPTRVLMMLRAGERWHPWGAVGPAAVPRAHHRAGGAEARPPGRGGGVLLRRGGLHGDAPLLVCAASGEHSGAGCGCCCSPVLTSRRSTRLSAPP